MLTEIIYALGKQCGKIIAKSVGHILATSVFQCCYIPHFVNLHKLLKTLLLSSTHNCRLMSCTGTGASTEHKTDMVFEAI